MGRDRMIAALQALQRSIETVDTRTAPSMQAFKISTGRAGGFLALFSSHPPLEERIARLETMTSL